MTEVRVAARCRNMLGEGAVWCGELRVLYWVDIEEAQVWRFDPRSEETRSWTLPERVAAIALRHSSSALLALASGLETFDFATQTPARLRDVALPDGVRLNDGHCDRQGRFVFGCHVERGGATAPLFRFDAAHQVIRLLDGGFRTANSIAFSPDGRTMYFADSPRRTLEAIAYDPATGAVGTRRVLAHIEGPGVPDGACTDAEGFVWVTVWEGYRVERWSPDGRLVATVHVPVRKPTCCAFGGADLDVLYVTTSRLGSTDAELEREPTSGSLYALRPGVRGLPDTPFAG
jgi:L-arabinonolactonase